VSRLLIDTQVWLWMLGARSRLRPETLALIAGADTEVLLSAASGWEIAIKYQVGKLKLPEHPSRYVPDRLRRTGMTPLAVEHSHVLQTAELPLHHRDPFDRLLVAQAQILDISIVTADPQIAAYDVGVVPA
jgi:PIN domain nuclease of toxin-antitoxin system